MPAVAGALLLGVAPALGQTCGDADESGVISVTDGVQVLRAAAGLAADCPATLCDVDGSGTVSVTDGVNVLRAAAGLAVELRCTVLSAQERQVFGALQKSGQVTRILALGLEAADAGASGSVVGAATVSCPGGGSATDGGGGVVYDQCRVKATVCSGTGAMVGGSFEPSLACNDLETEQAFELAASVAPSETASGRAITGTATGTQGPSAVFRFDYDALTLDEDERGGRAAGQIAVGGTFFAGVFEQVEVSFPGRNPETDEPDPGFAKIVGLRSGGGGIIFVFVFDLNLATGKLTVR
jgi:hypothetical protein